MKLKKLISTFAAVSILGTSCAIMPMAAFAEEYTCALTNSGHSGSANGTGLFVGTVGTATGGSIDRAPYVAGVTGNNAVTVGSARIGALEFTVDGSIDPETITSATLNLHVNDINDNYAATDWMLLAAYETENPTLTYSVGNMNQGLYPAVNNDYSYEAAFWTNEQCSDSNLGWKTMDVKRAVVHALEKDGGSSDAVKVVLRLQVPACALNVSIADNAPYITLKTGEKVEGVIRTVDQNGNEILPERTFAAGEGEYTYSEAIEELLEIDGATYMFDKNASVTTITLEKDGANEILLVYNNLGDVTSFSGNTLIDRGATCWFADPRSVTFEHEDIYENGELVLPASSKTIVGAIDTDGTVKATQYDNLTGQLVSVVIDTGFQADDHNNPTFLYLPDHRIMVFWSQHTAEEYWYYRVTQEPDDLTTLGEEKRVSVAGYGNYTYPSPFYMTDAPDSFFICWRGVSWHPTIAKYSLPDENDDIVCEIAPTQIVQAIGDRPYVKYESNGKDRIYFTFTTAHPDMNNPNWVYYSELDINTLNLYDVEGNLLCEGANLPFGKNNKINTSSNYGSLTVDAPTNKRDWVWDVAKDENGNPVILFTQISPDKSQHDYYYGKWNPETKTWDKTYIADGGGWFHQNASNQEMCYSGGMCLDHSDPSVVYLSKPTDGIYGSVYEIWKLEMDGVSIKSETPVTMNSQYNNVRPFVAWGSSPDDLISLTWMNGLYYYWITSSDIPDAFPTSIMTTGEVPEFDLSYGINKLTIPKVITSDFALPAVAGDGTQLTWTSSDSSVIDAQGYVYVSDEEKTVTLTAKNQYGEKQFNVTVPARDVMANNMRLSYRFESDDVYTKDGVTYVADKSGNGNDAAIYGSGEVNGVLDLTKNTTNMSTNGYAIAPAGVLSGVRSYTFALRINASNLNTQPRLYDFGMDSGNSVFLRGNQFSAGLKYNNGTTALISPSTVLQPGTEYFLTVTYDAKTKTTKMYVDGAMVTQSTSITSEPYLFGQDGRNYIGRTQWWDSTVSADNADYCGTIDDFYLFDAALTEEEIAALYENRAEDGGDNEGDGNEGDGNEGDGNEGDGNEGDGNEGDGNEGDGDEGDGNEGDGNEGDGNEGDGNEGDGNEGDGNEGDGNEGDDTEEFGASVTVGEAEITVDITKGEIGENAVIIITAYTADGRIINAVIADGTSVTLPNENVAMIKVFCFESLENLKPVCDAIVKSL